MHARARYRIGDLKWLVIVLHSVREKSLYGTFNLVSSLLSHFNLSKSHRNGMKWSELNTINKSLKVTFFFVILSTKDTLNLYKHSFGAKREGKKGKKISLPLLRFEPTPLREKWKKWRPRQLGHADFIL